MSFNEQQLKAIEYHFVEKGIICKCPMCGTNRWEPPESVALPILKPGTQELETPKIVPATAMACGHCGYLLFFSSQIIGTAK